MIMNCQYRFISCNKGTNLVGNVANVEGWECVETRNIWDISTFPSILHSKK